MSHWIIGSLNSIKRLIHSVMKLATVFMNESLNHWFTQFNQTPDSFSNEASDCLYEWVTESLAHLIHSKSWFFQKWRKWLSLWMSYWIIDSVRSETKLATVFMNQSLNHQKCGFIQYQHTTVLLAVLNAEESL